MSFQLEQNSIAQFSLVVAYTHQLGGTCLEEY